MSVKNVQHFQKTPVLGSLFYQKETPTQVFSCEFLEILNNSFFYKHLWATAFVNTYLLEFRSVFSLFSANVDHN